MSEAFTRLRDLVAYLRSEEGCPWDRDQTLDSLKPHLLEEMHEACEAIEEDTTAKIRKELGDVLFLLLFVARIAEEEGRFSFDEVMEETYTKMKERHPHVFGERQDMGPDQVLDVWERAKQKQKPEGESVLSGVPKGLAALIKAQRIQQRAASLGFDWEEVASAFEKLKEEISEFEHAWQGEDKGRIMDEMGDILFSLVNVARFLGIRAEDALQGTNEKFRRRFSYVEKELASRGTMTLNEMDRIWEKSKKEET
ncbi:MAG: nucleoside triphosphate pyrophosphohydrolase [Candidatus Eisenbacteria bacterium]